MSINEITGDKIQTKVSTQSYRDNYDAIFRKKVETSLEVLVDQPNNEDTRGKARGIIESHFVAWDGHALVYNQDGEDIKAKFKEMLLKVPNLRVLPDIQPGDDIVGVVSRHTTDEYFNQEFLNKEFANTETIAVYAVERHMRVVDGAARNGIKLRYRTTQKEINGSFNQ